MTQPAKPWAALTAVEKGAAVMPLILAGKSYAEISTELAADRSAVAGVVHRLRQQKKLPRPAGKRATGAAGGAIGMAKARKRREQASRAITAPKTASAPGPTPKPVAEPAESASASAHDLIASFIVKNGVRRFERGVSNDLIHIKNFAADRGFEVLFTQRGITPYTIKPVTGRARSVTRAGLYQFVDELRVAEGLEPILPPKEFAHGENPRRF